MIYRMDILDSKLDRILVLQDELDRILDLQKRLWGCLARVSKTQDKL